MALIPPDDLAPPPPSQAMVATKAGRVVVIIPYSRLTSEGPASLLVSGAGGMGPGICLGQDDRGPGQEGH